MTPFQYAGGESIANVDMDGLEPCPVNVVSSAVSNGSKALTIGSIAVHVTQFVTNLDRLTAITARGVSDALYNANTVGLYDLFGGNHLDSYDDPYEQAAYLRGRIAGDGIALAQSTEEMTSGGAIAATTGAETLGVGVGVGVVVGLHGAGVAGTATADATWSLKKLYELNVEVTVTTSQELKFEPLTNTKAFKEAVKEQQQVKKRKSVNQLNQEVKSRKAPKSIKRFDKGRGTKNLPEDEVHFTDGSSLYRNGVWRHNKANHKLTNKEIKYLKDNGWTIPK